MRGHGKEDIRSTRDESLFNYNKEAVSLKRSTSLLVRSQKWMTTELQEVFKKFNVNRDGKISTLKLGSIIGSLEQAALEQELENMICEVNGDDDGCISFLKSRDENQNDK
ncbi:hypothetical protein Fmac_023687 [Flemingia macrophylla]|uniref:EF-hand domain-containing protein n=1 Tax=Flemingia macrophylla TaxID=520843 RepID=A0ABD1LM77_9FABA